tara:strand:+ start:85 stop:387 length:303 start_codon:yes stop_codon:yes gene_type:complete
MVPPLGIGIGLGSSMWGDDTAVVIEDYMWEIHTTAGAGNLTPLLRGTASDFHDTWDLISISDGLVDYQPQTTATVSDEGYWDIGNAVSATDTDYIRPLDV